MPVDPIAELRSSLTEAIRALSEAPPEAEPGLERPPRPELGDYSTNAAMLLAPVLGENPRAVAERLAAALSASLAQGARVEVAGPGFVNLFLPDRWYRERIAEVLAAGGEFGVSPSGGERVLVEFVSANPTGPLTAAGGRHAAYGDSVARALELAGYAVGREYYVNDAGGQIERFAKSIAARMRREDPPEDGYAGEYVAELAAELRDAGADPADPQELARLGVAAMMARIEATLERFRVRIDTYCSERALYEDGRVETCLAELAKGGHTYEREGATWLRSSELGDDKDRVLVRAGGEPTYLAGDAAYHLDKLERGWEHLIDVWGADHHGYMNRLKAALAVLGRDPESLEIMVMQLVHLVDGGARAQMSKRAGEFVALDELLDDIGVDAARFFMVQRSQDTTLDLDLDLARRQSQDNPVYYVQYAHARIAGILAKAGTEGVSAAIEAIAAGAGEQAVLDAPCEAAETALVRRLLELPDEVRTAAERRAPHRLCAYATATAADFHVFYRDCRVVGAEPELERARLGLCLATKQVIATTLGALGIGAPERM